MQSQVFAETTRSAAEYQYMLFPRLLAVAERAWHKAQDWEDLKNNDNNAQSARDADWTHFANALGYRELRRLDKLGIAYRVPPPGAR
jgi:hexosaminidase